MKNILIGIIIGITSLIPGVSAGTIIYLSKDYNYITNLILHFKNNIKNIILLFIGLLSSVIIFSKAIEFLFKTIPFQTLYFFVGILLSNLKDSIKKQETYNIFYLILGIIIILVIKCLCPVSNVIITNYPKLSFLFLLGFGICGFFDGALTITPGISGSMVMMILGPYYLYKSYLANITNNLIFIVPLLFYFLGDIIGLFLGTKFSKYMLEKHKITFTSILLGMVITSIIVLIPNHFSFSCLIVLFIGYFVKN